MELTTEQMEQLFSLEQVHLAEVIKVYWGGEDDEENIRYYGTTAWNELGNYINIPFKPVEPRLLTQGSVHPIPLFADINSQPVTFTFADTDQTIKGKFQQFGSVKFELWYFFPQLNASVQKCFGHLSVPEIYGLKQQVSKGVFGYQNPEFLLPSEIRMKECRFRNFGGELETQEDVDRCGCPYDKHLGGTEGVNNPATSQPFTYCPRLNEADCTARFGHSRYFGGFHFEDKGVTVNSRFISSKGQSNDSLVRYPISVVFGRKIIMRLPVLQFYTTSSGSDNNRGSVRIIAEVSNDLVSSIFMVGYNGTTSAVQSYQARLGSRGQSPTGWVAGVSNYSGCAHVYLVGNHSSNPGSVTVDSIRASAFVHGFKNVRVYTDFDSFTKSFNSHRIWALLELYTNNRWGLGYRHDKFNLDDLISAHEWCETPVRFQLTIEGEDGSSELKTWDLKPRDDGSMGGRTIFDCNVQGRPAAEQITEIARTGRFSVPYQLDDKYTISVLSKATPEELENAEVFSDRIGGNILRSGEGSTLSFSQIPPETLTNSVVSTFEDAENNDISRPITCRDNNQQALAGKILGQGGFKENKTSYLAYGVRRLEEVIKFGYSILWFGEFDKGGIKNNLKAEFVTTQREAMRITKKFQVIKIESAQNNYLSPEGDPFQYFRVIDAVINPDLSVSVICQAYNEAAYENFEVDLADAVGDPTEPETQDMLYPQPVVESLPVSTTYADGFVEVTI